MKFLICIIGLIGSVIGDKLIVNSPVKNQMIKTENIDIDIQVDKSSINKVSIELFDMNGKINQTFVDTTNSDIVKFEMKTDIKKGQVKTYEVKIVGYSEGGFKNVEGVSIPIIIDFVSDKLPKNVPKTTDLPQENSANAKISVGIVLQAIFGILVFLYN